MKTFKENETNEFTKVIPFNLFERPFIPTAKSYEHLELRNLPRLPIPDLEFTCRKYLKTVKCLLSPEEFLETKKKVIEFLVDEEGKSLQEELLQLDAISPTSYLEGFWDSMYLELRCSNVEVNPYFIAKNDPRRLTQYDRAANVVHSSFVFAQMINNNHIPRSMERDIPLCMTQFQWLFQSRIPMKDRDTKFRCGYSKHIVVLHNNNIYRVHVFDENDNLLPENIISKIFEGILKDEKVGDGIGILTSNLRDQWAMDREELVSCDKSGTNRRSLDIIDTALLVVVFHPTELDSFHEIQIALTHGSETQCANRWYDKMQIVVSRNAIVGVSMEHSSIDGDTLSSYLNFIVNKQFEEPVQIVQDFTIPQFEKLRWNLTKTLKKSMKNAMNRLVEYINTLDLFFLNFNEFGVDEIKKYIKVSPDAFFQMALQLAYYRLHQQDGSTYESINTKRFYHGRTSCCRSMGMWSKRLCREMSNPNSTPQEKYSIFMKACDYHKRQVDEAKVGKDVDRHLYALNWLAQLRMQKLPNYQKPKIFTDVAWERMRTDKLSTSCIPSSHIVFGGFAPVNEECFGIAYFTAKNYFISAISNYQGRASMFGNCLRQCLIELRQLGSCMSKI